MSPFTLEQPRIEPKPCKTVNTVDASIENAGERLAFMKLSAHCKSGFYALVTCRKTSLVGIPTLGRVGRPKRYATCSQLREGAGTEARRCETVGADPLVRRVARCASGDAAHKLLHQPRCRPGHLMSRMRESSALGV